MMTANALADAGAMVGRTIETADGTSGTVTAVTIVSDGSYAVLDTGYTVRLGAGITIT